MQLSFQARLWKYEGKAAWYFVTVPQAESRELHEAAAGRMKAWGSLAVLVWIGETRWKTSLFWDGKREAYLLPVKSAVRAKEGLREGDMVGVTLEVAGLG
jgi:hypothetical protein